jgi:uncharacterized protein (TIGR01777 family)
MKIVIAGGTGLIGSALAWRLASVGHSIVVLTRSNVGRTAPPDGVRRVEWTPDGSSGPWAGEIDGADAVVNLAGTGLADSRWTEDRKEELRSSRVLPTRSLVAAVRQVVDKPAVFLQGSAVGFYGTREGARELDESFPPGDDFLGRLCVAWEAEAHPVTALGCRLVLFRSGVVLSREGGVLARMRWPFRWFVGGPVASGQQYVSWIHRDDWVALAIWVLSTPGASGIVNATAPAPVTNEVFSQALGRALHRPSWMPVPGLVLRALYGELATALLVRGQRAVPKRAVDLGFRFSHPAIEEAMEEAVGLGR